MLKDIRADDLAAQTIKGLLKNLNIEYKNIEDVIIGCANGEGEQGLNVARVISFLADLSIETGATTVNRLCASSMTAIHNAAGAIALNAGELFICGGVESMSHVPMIGFNFFVWFLIKVVETIKVNIAKINNFLIIDFSQYFQSPISFWILLKIHQN